MTNPIQQVLEAEREAMERVERARQEAEAGVSDARRIASQLIRRNEQRTQKVLMRYEEKQKQLMQAEADRLRREAGVELKHAQSGVDENFEVLVDETFAAFWPR